MKLLTVLRSVACSLLIITSVIVAKPAFASETLEPSASLDARLAIGSKFMCEAQFSGYVKCQGNNVEGQLGLGNTTNSTENLYVKEINQTLPPAVAVSAGDAHACALLSDSRVVCWGRNSSGQLGDGTFQARTTPVFVRTSSNELSDVVQISVAGDHSCARLSNGRVYCWGANESGQSGPLKYNAYYATYSVVYGKYAVATPVLRPGGYGEGYIIATQISAGAFRTCVASYGATVCWGENSGGIYWGGGWLSNGPWPYMFNLTPGVIGSLAVGMYHICAQNADPGRFISCWGTNNYGQIGRGDYFIPYSPNGIPMNWTSGSTVEVTTGDNHTCALSDLGQIKCWGANYSGQLGLGPDNSGSILSPALLAPIETNGLKPVGIVAHSDSTCVVLENGDIYCWGDNSAGQLIASGAAEINIPTRISGMNLFQDCSDPGVSISSSETTGNSAKVLFVNNTSGVCEGGLKLEFSTDNGATWRDGQDSVVGNTLYISDLIPGSTYLTRVRFLSAAGVGQPSNVVSIKTTKPAPLIVNTPTSEGITHGSFLGESSLSGGSASFNGSSVAGSFSWTNPTTKPNAGTARYSITFTPTDADNFSPIESFVELTVFKATPSVLVNPTASEIEVGQTLSAGALTAGSVSTAGTWSWLNPSLTPGRGTSSQVAVFTPTDSANYESVQVSIPVKVNLLPLRPAISSVTSDNGSITATIAPARGITARTITGYQYSLDGGQSVFAAELSGRSFMVSDLVNGQQVSVQVRAVNADGVSPWSSVKTAIPATTPDAPQITFVRAGMNSVLVHFVAPNTSGARIRSFQYSLDGGQSWQAPSVPAQLSPIKITGLTRKTDYQIQVRSINIKGAGEGSNVVNVRTANCSMSQCTKFYLP